MFGRGRLDFPLPGMSDVMPYPSSRFSDLDGTRLGAYREAWREHLASIVGSFRPDVLHVHHLWIVGSLVKDAAPGVPVLNHCHGTGCARNERFAVLHDEHVGKVSRALGVGRQRILVVGAGYREDLFHASGRVRRPGRRRLLYVGKYSTAKGVPWLLDAVERLDGVELHVAGSGAGDEADRLRWRMTAMPRVTLHGMLDQPTLADLMRDCDVCVLPSFYEGLPLVLVEALACGCRLVATALEGVVHRLVPALGQALHTVPVPPLLAADTPDPAALPAFVDDLTAALDRALALGPVDDPETVAPGALEEFGWGAVFRRVEPVWRELAAGGG